MSARKSRREIFEVLKGKTRRKEPLSRHTTFRIGGLAELFVEPRDLRDLKSLVVLARKHKVPLRLLGAGSNILVNDKGVKGVVLRLSAPFFKKISLQGDYVEVGSGISLAALSNFCSRRSLSGLEFLTGIPGTVGGALAMNAGAWGQAIGNLVEKALVMDYNGNNRLLGKKNIRFGYRNSSLKKFIILSARLRLRKKGSLVIKSALRQYQKSRKDNQDCGAANAGCVFKNPVGYKSAGWLIDLCGFKGKKCGGASVSHKHANFILNQRQARAQDVLRLMALIKKTVKKKFDVDLHPEIKIWG
jgi:UDP-N-acetylmuramate dehydrogenase